MKLAPALLGLLLPIVGASAAPHAPDEILSAVQTRLETGRSLDELIDALVDLPSKDLNKIEEEVEKAWGHIHTQYLSAFEKEAKDQNSGQFRQENKKLVRQLRDNFHNVRKLGEGPMKDAIKKTSSPALNQLRELLLPKPSRILDIGGPKLKQQRSLAFGLAKFRDGIREANVATGEEDSEAILFDGEKKIAGGLSGIDRDGLRIMADNRQVAAKTELPEAERLGIEELNTMRLLLNLNALRLDPKLCEAGRGHSQDMKEHNFFSHTSPIPGKNSPSARASKAGTSGGGENIYMGSKSPKAANKGWFYSPGHHKNMFNAGYKRVGLGNYRSHWTQMFGR
ncbi:MAG: CAP domain-containing protein [Akkermansiaceae bacterium]|nr:CAP domain-containing protein [Akkermansiaceae bacterium]